MNNSASEGYGSGDGLGDAARLERASEIFFAVRGMGLAEREEAIERQITAQVTTAWNQMIAAREEIAASVSRVAAAEIALEGAKQELAVGERITLDVLDQERELLEAQLGQVDAERAAYLAAHDVLAAMGELRPERLGRQ